MEPYQVIPLVLTGAATVALHGVAYPSATLSNSAVDLVVYLPDAEKGYYRGPRFDWSSLVSKLSHNGHSWFWDWKTKPHNPLASDDVSGPATEFGGGGEPPFPPGYDEAAPGETFVKIGVGELRKPEKPEYGRERHRYEINYPYKSERFFPWKTQHGDDWIEFVQESPPIKGYRYRLTRRFELTESPAGFVMKCQLENLGEKPITQNCYEHNFINVDGHAIGPDWNVIYPFTPVSKPMPGVGNNDLVAFSGREAHITRVFAPKDSFEQLLDGFGGKPADNTVTVYNNTLKTGIRVSGDHPIVRNNLFCVEKAICPELFISIHLQPGASLRWHVTYELTNEPK